MRIRTGVLPAVLVVVAVLLGAPAHAQNMVGVTGGLNLSTVSFDPSVSSALQEEGFDSGGSTGKAGFGVGIAFQRALSPKVNLRLHGLYNQVGFGIEGRATFDIAGAAAGAMASPAGASGTFEFENNVTLHEFNIDALVNVPVGAAAKFSINAGMFFSFLMGQKETFREVFDGVVDEEEVAEEDEFDLKSNDAGIGIGAEFKITPKVILGALYRIGLVDRNDEEEAPFNSMKTRAIFIYVVIPIGGN